MSETHELAVMRDSVYPLKLTKFAKEFDDGNYACSVVRECPGRRRRRRRRPDLMLLARAPEDRGGGPRRARHCSTHPPDES